MGCGASSDAAQVREPVAQEGGGEIDEELEMEFGNTRLDKAGNTINKYDTNEKKPEADNGLFELLD